MKDYSNNKEERNDFILSYQIDYKKEFIYIYYANDSVEKVKYSEKCEKDILKKMKIQVNKAYKNYKNYENDYVKMDVILLMALTFLVITSLLIFISPLYFVIPLCSAGVALFAQIRAFELKKIKDDLRKNYLFLKNEHAINNKKMCERAFRTCYKRTVKEKLDNKVKFTINDTEAFTFDEMLYLDNKFQYYREKQNEEYTRSRDKSKRKIKWFYIIV